jgi:hypothetical protein
MRTSEQLRQIATATTRPVRVESSARHAMFNLSAMEVNPITHESTNLSNDDVLEAFIAEQKTPAAGSRN